MRRLSRAAALGGLMLATGSVASAHHSATASYEANRSIEIRGTVREFSWKNPHCHLYIDVAAGPFKGGTYTVEMSSPIVLADEGWSKTSVRAGDAVVIQVHPSRDGAAIGLCRSCPVAFNGKAMKSQVLQN